MMERAFSDTLWLKLGLWECKQSSVGAVAVL